MTPLDHIRLTAEGLVRNFGTEAASEAERLAKRHALHPDPQALWTAVAEHVRAMVPPKPAR